MARLDAASGLVRRIAGPARVGPASAHELGFGLRLALGPLLALGLGGCAQEAPIPARDANPAHIVVVAGPPSERVAAGRARLGVGWSPDVEVDTEDRVHVVWTDADRGDVLYAMAPPGSATPGPPELVEGAGAAGAFVRLALGPGSVPVVSFHRQDIHTLQVAHRPSDLAALAAAGSRVEVPPPPGKKAPLGPRWSVEDVAYGRDVGAGSALVVDNHGRPHLLFNARGTHVRLARRPHDAPAFGANASGRWETAEVATGSGQTPDARNALLVLEDGTEIAAFCDHQVVASRLRVAVRAAGQMGFASLPVAPMRDGFVGLSSALWPRADGRIDIAFTDASDRALRVRALRPTATTSEDALLARHVSGHAVMQRARDGTLWVLGPSSAQDGTGARELVLLEHPGGDPARARRTVLARGVSERMWIDLALRADGRPVSVWFDDELKSLKLHAP